jgi:hypothetical protein
MSDRDDGPISDGEILELRDNVTDFYHGIEDTDRLMRFARALLRREGERLVKEVSGPFDVVLVTKVTATIRRLLGVEETKP